MSSNRSSTRLPLAADGLFSGHPEGTRGGIPLAPVEEDATVVDSSWASSTAALRREGVRGGLRLGHEEEHAAVVDTSQASSSTAALRREGVRRLGHEEEAAALRGQAVALGRQEDATKALVLRGEHGTRGGLPLEEPTGGIQGLPTPGLRSSKSTAALPTRGAALNPQAMMPCGSSSSADNKGGGLSIDVDEKRQFQAILQNLNTNEPSSIRSICRTALKLYHDGQNGLALAISEYLVGETKCPENTVALNLCAGLHHNEGAEAMQLVHGGDKKASRAAAFHYSRARTHYEAAARLAPRCIVTAVAHGKVLAVSQLFASAQQELQRASSISIGSADDPAKHNVGCDIRLRANSEEILHTTPVARIGKAHAEAVREVQEFESMICDKYIPSICTDSLMQLETGNCTLEQVLGLAQSMSHHFKYCIRAHLFLTYVQLLCLEGSDEGMVTMKLEDALVTLKENTKTYRNSLFTAFLRAKILLMAGNLIDASTEVCRALDVRAPSDPKTEDIPVGFVEGVDAYGRTSFMRKILEDMLTHIRVSEEPNQEDNEAPLSSSSAKPSSFAKCKHNSAFLYTHVPKKHQDPPLKFTGIEVPEKKGPPTFPVHFVRGKLVSVENWNLYRKFCMASSKCEKGQIACHLCFFESGSDRIISKRDEIAHYHQKHYVKDKEKAGYIRCEVAGCHARIRTSNDLHLHHYFVHRLGPRWWTIT